MERIGYSWIKINLDGIHHVCQEAKFPSPQLILCPKFEEGPNRTSFATGSLTDAYRDCSSLWLRWADALLQREVNKNMEKLRKERPSPHPPKCLVQGSNHYGEWDRCLRCRTKVAYKPQVKPEKKTRSRGRDAVYVPTAAPRREWRKPRRSQPR